MSLSGTDTPMELISQVTELNDLSEFMQDPELDRAMHLMVRLYNEKGKMNPSQAAALIVELQALASEFAFKATFYMGIGKKGQAETHKKNVYMTAKEAINRLVDSLKYVSKS